MGVRSERSLWRTWGRLPSHSSDSDVRKFGLESVEWSRVDSDSDKLRHGHGFITFQYPYLFVSS